MIELAVGKTDSGIRWKLFVSEPVDVDDLRNIGNLIHGGATKLEEEEQDLPSGPTPAEHK